MPQIDIDGAASRLSADNIRGQSGSTITIVSGHNLVGSGSGLTALNASNLASGTLPMARLSGTLPALNGSALTSLPAVSVKVGVFTKDMTDSVASQAITGVGFQPTGILFVGTLISTPAIYAAVGFGTTAKIQAMTQAYSGNWFQSGSRFRLHLTTTVERGFYIASMDSDGFTLTWDAGNNSPTGTSQLTYCAIR